MPLNKTTMLNVLALQKVCVIKRHNEFHQWLWLMRHLPGPLTGGQEITVSPSAKIATWRYWFRLSRDVYGGNSPSLPILRQRRWSLLYDVN